MKSKRVLIVATLPDWHDIWFRKLGKNAGLDGPLALVSAVSAREARDLVVDDPRFDACVVAACSDDPLTNRSLVPLVRVLADNSMTLIAAGEKDERQQLVRAGCRHEATMAALPTKLLEVLGV